MGEKHFDFDGDYGAHYDSFIRQVIPGYESLHALSCALLEPGCGNDGRVLVVGCGSGAELACMGELQPRWSFLGIDTSESMIAQTTRLIGSRGWENRVSLVHGSLESLSCNQQFNGATCILVSHFMEGDQAKTSLFRQIGERLTKGGRLIVADACDEDSESFRTMMDCRWNFARARGADTNRYQKFQADCREALKPVPPEHEEQLIRSAGFQSVRRFWTSLHINAWVAWDHSARI